MTLSIVLIILTVRSSDFSGNDENGDADGGGDDIVRIDVCR